MKEKRYRELLLELGIAGNRTGDEIREHLEIKLNEYLERPDGEAMVERIEEALECLEEQIKALDSGLGIKEEKKMMDTSLDDLKADSQKDSKVLSWSGGSKTAGSSVAQQTGHNYGGSQAVSSSKWFASISANVTVDNQFIQAEDCLKYEQWENAIRIFNSILEQEARNPGAHLGIALAKNQLHEPAEIGTAVNKPMDTDVDLRKAYDFGNSAQAKYLEDALRERATQLLYETAYKMMKQAKTAGSLRAAAKKFKELDDYRDAKEQAEECFRIADTKEATEKQAEEIKRKEKQKKDDIEQMNKLVLRLKEAHYDQASNYLEQIKGLRRKSEVVRAKFSDEDYEELVRLVDKKREISEKDKKRSKQKGFNAIFITLLLIICMIPVGFPVLNANLRNEEFKSWPIIPITSYEAVVSVKHSWIVTLAQLGEFTLYGNDSDFNELKLFMPRTTFLSKLKLVNFDDSEIALKTVAFSVEIINCSELESLEIAEGTTEVMISDSEKLSKLILPESVLRLTIEDCASLNQTDLLTEFVERGIKVVIDGQKIGGEEP